MIYVYVEASIFSLLCLFSFFVPLSRMLVYMCSVVNIEKVISVIRHREAENCPPLGYYAASSGNFLLTFQDNLLVPSSGFKNPKESI